MSQEQLIILLFKITLIADEAAIVAFIVIYTLFAKWWKNIIGRSIVLLDGLLGLAFLPSIISFFFHFSRLTSRIAGWVDLGIFALIAGVMIWRSVIWIRIHRKSGEVDDGYRQT